MKSIAYFKNGELEWHIGITIVFNGHANDDKAKRKAVMSEIGKRWPGAKGFVQKIEVRNDG